MFEKFIFTADIHLKMWSDKEHDDEGRPLKLIEILSTIEQMCVYAKANDIPSIVIGGDLNDTKGVVSVRAFLMFQQIVNEHSDLNFYILHGNHDACTGRVEEEESAIQLLEPFENVTILMDTQRIENILFLPYSKNLTEVLQRESDNGFDDIDIVISHLGLNEGTLSTGISIKSSMTARSFEGFKLVLLGHYHKPQLIESGDTKIYYVGSPIPVRRDEATEEKRFLVVDPETCEIESVSTTGYRRYVEVIIEEGYDADAITQQIQEAKDAGHHVVVRNHTPHVPKELEKMVEDVQVVDMYEAEEEMRGITSTMSAEQQCKKYLEIEEIPEEDHNEFLAIGMECVAGDVDA